MNLEKERTPFKYLNFGVFFLTGFLGLFLSILWLATDHSAAANNMNLLWAFPPNLIVAFLLFGNTSQNLQKSI